MTTAVRPPSPATLFSPLEHQRRFVDIARTRPRYMLGWKPGAGKTIAVLLVIADRPMPTLVIAPRSILRSAWAADARRVGVRAVVYHGDKRDRNAIFRNHIANGRFDLVVTTYDTFRNDRAALTANGLFRRLVVDESSKIKNRDAKITVEIQKFAATVDEVYLLSGTPAPNGPDEYWSQLAAIDRRLGTPPWAPAAVPMNFWQWANHWLTPRKRTVPIKTRVEDGTFERTGSREVIEGWSVRKGREKDFHEMLSSHIWFLDTQDCVDLPESRDIVIQVDLSSDEDAAYETVLEELRVAFASGKCINVAVEGKMQKLRQITAGFVYGGDPVAAHHIGKSKRDAISDLVETIGPDEPVVVWGEFRHEIEAVADDLAQVDGRTVRTIYGGTKDPGADIADFQAGRYNTVVCHPASVGHGATLTAARYCIFASIGWSWELHEQARARILRYGQDRKVVYYYILSPGTVDYNIRDGLRRKEHQSAAISRAVRELVSGVSQQE